MTRIAWAEWRPGPASKRGYGGTTQLPVSYKEGEVKHSAEGPLSATFGVLDNPSRQASWHFTLPKQGPVRVYQHYELEDICWHCGLPGDERHDTSLVGNLTLWGEEHEGTAGEALTPWQVENTIKLSEDLRGQSPTYGREPPTLRVNLWEHNWLSPAPTACPSGRIPWVGIIAALQEDEMTPEEKQQLQNATNDILTVSAQAEAARKLAAATADDFKAFKEAEAAVNAGIYGAVVEVVKALPGGDSNLATKVEALEKRVGDAAKVLSGDG